MAFVENLGAYLADYGVPCSKGATPFLGILNQADERISSNGPDVISRKYELTYTTADVTLHQFDTLTVNSISGYKVLETLQIDDGVFSIAALEK